MVTPLVTPWLHLENRCNQYVLIKVSGRSWSPVYHELAADGSTPLCGTQIKASDWTLQTRERAWRRRPCRQCAAALAQEAVCQP